MKTKTKQLLDDLVKYQEVHQFDSVVKLCKAFVLDKKINLTWDSLRSVVYRYNPPLVMPTDEMRIKRIKPKDTEFKRLFYDIETSPNVVLSWRIGRKVNITPESILKERAIICVCWKWEGEDLVYSLTWDDNQCDKKLLEEFSKIISKSDEAIAHNGDRFDDKWLRSRCLFHRIQYPDKVKSLDTLKKAKSHLYLNSNRLDYIARYLGLGGKMDTGGYDLWKDVCLDNCPEALQKMVDYCKKDVTLLEEVYHELENYITPNSHVGVMDGEEKHSCPSCGSDNLYLVKDITTLSGTLQRQMKCNTCTRFFKVSNRTYQNWLIRKK